MKHTYLFVFISLMLLSACSAPGNTVSVSDQMNDVISQSILDYNADGYRETDKQFEAHKIYGAKEINGIIEVYLYSVYLGFNKETKTQEQAGGSFPILIKLKEENNTFRVVEYREPQDGSMYAESINKMFPKNIATHAIKDTGNVKDLHDEIKLQAEEWLEENK